MENKEYEYSSVYDAFYDPIEDIWIDTQCSDPTCTYCVGRPARPSLCEEL